jgi:hypothetical protein
MKHLWACALLAATVGGCGGGGNSSPAPAVNAPSPLPSTGATPSPAPSATPSPPAPQASTYALEAADLNGFTTAVGALCPANPSAATRFDVEMLQANGNALITVLPGESVAQAQAMAANAVAFAIEAERALPGIGFMINPVYPLLVQNQSNAPAWWNTSANYPVFSAYYTALAQGLKQSGIAYDVETNLAFPSYSGQNYTGVTIAQLEAGIAEDANNTLALMSPVDLNLSSEPLTLSQNTGQASLNTVAGYQAFVTAIRAGVTGPAGSATKIGAGSADWSPTAFLSATESLSTLDYNDLHLYPPDVLTTPGGGIAQVEAMAPSLTGKPAVITENWDEKDAGDAGNYNAANAPQLEQLNVYSFWAPLDAQYITTMMRFARCQNVAMVDFWYEWELFAYLDYGTASGLTPSAAQSAIATAAGQAAAAGTLSTSGQALYTGLTGRTPAGVRGGYAASAGRN